MGFSVCATCQKCFTKSRQLAAKSALKIKKRRHIHILNKCSAGRLGYITLLQLPLRKGFLYKVLGNASYLWRTLLGLCVNSHCRANWSNELSAKSPGKRTAHSAHFIWDLKCFVLVELKYPSHPALDASCRS